MRRKIIAGNWKMNLDHMESATLAEGLVSGLRAGGSSAEVIVFPPFTSIPAVAASLDGSEILFGAQDLWYEPSGAFTGEISAGMLRSLGCSHVLVGHSERRHVIGEDGGLLAKKLRAALDAGLKPVFCVGELLEQRESGRATEVVSQQLSEVLDGLDHEQVSDTVIAYEPVWAIGTGKTATPGDASSMHGFIRGWILSAFGEEAAGAMPILYGGSVKPDNAGSLLASPDIDGALVGGAALDRDSFLDIVFSNST
ncbi:MAG TPA: triose-phosphate isomerase [Candidatus Krumholzibacterium sp.]|nr:triose-phosphate isomerase [Candidatus Krumholzibacterium sp.]